MNKKFLNLGTALSREQMKKVTGGCGMGELCHDIGDDGLDGCSTDQDCATGKVIDCNGTPTQSGPGRCYDSGNGKRCHYSVAC